LRWRSVQTAAWFIRRVAGLRSDRADVSQRNSWPATPVRSRQASARCWRAHRDTKRWGWDERGPRGSCCDLSSVLVVRWRGLGCRRYWSHARACTKCDVPAWPSAQPAGVRHCRGRSLLPHLHSARNLSPLRYVSPRSGAAARGGSTPGR
jgi:hypothetical protein